MRPSPRPKALAAPRSAGATARRLSARCRSSRPPTSQLSGVVALGSTSLAVCCTPPEWWGSLDEQPLPASFLTRNSRNSRPSTVCSDEWPAWFSFWFSGRWRALAKGTVWAVFFRVILLLLRRAGAYSSNSTRTPAIKHEHMRTPALSALRQRQRQRQDQRQAQHLAPSACSGFSAARESETDCDIRVGKPPKLAHNRGNAQVVVAPRVGTTKDRCG